jgi:hypothetical protein
MTYLGSLTADGGGNFWGILDVTGKEPRVGNRITSTTTHINDNTSEFGTTVSILVLMTPRAMI